MDKKELIETVADTLGEVDCHYCGILNPECVKCENTFSDDETLWCDNTGSHYCEDCYNKLGKGKV